MRRSMIWTAAAAITLAMTGTAMAQAPTKDQRAALRANCPADFKAQCKGVKANSMDALNCLKQNVAKLSPGCKTAVQALNSK